jgi:murein DD-endopeptidase MepM/ murein hydrolase activator NlpD
MSLDHCFPPFTSPVFFTPDDSAMSKRVITTSLLTGWLLVNPAAIGVQATELSSRTAVEAVTEAADTTAAPLVQAPAVELIVPEAVTEVSPVPVAQPFEMLQLDAAETFIDRTDYALGATQEGRSSVSVPPTLPAAAVAAASERVGEPVGEPMGIAPTSVQVGALNLSSAGVQWQPEAAVDSAPSTASVTMPSAAYFDPKLLQAMVAQSPLAKLRMVFPVAIPSPITSLFGWRIHPISGSQRMHTGTDIGAPMGAPVMAALAGKVMLAGDMGGYGLAVAIEHENGTRQTLYGHMSALFVRPGDVVQQGTVIGQVGSTGASTGAHLHFELRQMLPDGSWVAMDAGKPLELAMGELLRSLQIAQQPPVRKTALKP